jgi:hypothetical protein
MTLNVPVDIRRRIAALFGALALASAGLSCLDDSPLAPQQGDRSGSLARLGISAQVVGGDGRHVALKVFYRRTDETEIPVLERKISVEAGAQQVSVSVDVAACLADEQRETTSEMLGCPLYVGFRLMESETVVLDSTTVGPVEGAPGETSEVPGVLLEQRVASIEITPPALVVSVGETIRPQVILRDRAGQEVTGYTVDWTSADPTIATIEGGLLRGVMGGSTTVTATSWGASVVIPVAVTVPAGRVLVASTPVNPTAIVAQAQTLAVRVTTAQGAPVAAVLVTFEPSQGAGTVAPASVLTDNAGIASTTWTAGTGAGTQIVTARAELLDPVIFTAQVAPGAITRIDAVAGAGQSAIAATAVSVDPVFRVTDAYGNPLAGVTVAFQVTGGGSVANVSAVTDAAGLASPGRWTLGAVAGANTVQASAGSLMSPVITATGTAREFNLVLEVSPETQQLAGVSNPVTFTARATANIPITGIAIREMSGTIGPVLPGCTTTGVNSLTASVVCRVDLFPTPGSYQYVATASSENSFATTNPVIVTVVQPAVSVTLTGPSEAIAAGATGTYTFTATATSAAPITGVTISRAPDNTGPTPSNCSTTGLSSTSATLTCRVDVFPATGSFAYIASATSAGTGAGSSAPITVVVSQPGVAVSLTGPTEVLAGVPGSYVFRATASASAPITNVIISRTTGGITPSPENCTTTGLNTPTATITCSVSVFAFPGTHEYVASATSAGSATAQSAPHRVVATVPPLAVELTGTSSVVAGVPGTYTFTATATGAAPITNVIISRTTGGITPSPENCTTTGLNTPTATITCSVSVFAFPGTHEYVASATSAGSATAQSAPHRVVATVPPE